MSARRRTQAVRPARVVLALLLAALPAGVLLLVDRGSDDPGALAATAPANGETTAASDPPPVDAAAYAVLDGQTRRIVASRNGRARRAVASITKLMTARLVLAAGDPEHVVVVPDLPREEGESTIGLEPGEAQTRDVLLRAMLIASAGDAADALAVDLAGSTAAFVEQMNAEAARLRLRDTHYVNATGLDASGQHSTARDSVRLAYVLMQDPAFRPIVLDTEATLHDRSLPATNRLLGRYDGADGVKTGHTDEAGYGMVASATRDGHRIYVCVLGAPSEDARDEAATALLDWAFAR